MSMSKARGNNAFQPGRELLERRELLAKTIRGLDPDGDRWVLRLLGPGSVAVVNVNGSDGQPIPIGQPALIRSISIAGASPGSTRLIGAVRQGEAGDGRVFFSSLTESASTAPAANVGVGVLAIDIPDFWLGATAPITTGTSAVQGTIDIPDGVVTLRFGGIDTTFNGLQTNTINDSFNVNLGLPYRIGTSIVVDRIITANRPMSGSQAATMDTANINVEGRINLFQANRIDGDETLNLGENGFFDGNNTGGTTITSGPAGTTFLGTVLGFIGRFRVGGNATNLSVNVTPTTGDESAITNLSIGGETNKVSINADSALRTAQFGLGLDTVFIQADNLQYLGANRGAVGSQIVAARGAGLLNFGGDVSDTQVLAGFVTNQSNSGNPFIAQELGDMTVLVAGDVTNSVFAASYEPNEDGVFGSPDDLRLVGMIDAKVEGFIDNSANIDVDPEAADQAFFARNLQFARGPIVPPAAPAAPYNRTETPPRTVGVKGVGGGPKGPFFRFVPGNNRRAQA